MTLTKATGIIKEYTDILSKDCLPPVYVLYPSVINKMQMHKEWINEIRSIMVQSSIAKDQVLNIDNRKRKKHNKKLHLLGENHTDNQSDYSESTERSEGNRKNPEIADNHVFGEGAHVFIDSLMIPARILQRYTRAGAIQNVCRIVRLLEKEKGADNRKETQENLHTKLAKALVKLWRNSPLDVQLLLAGLSLFKRVKLSTSILSHRSQGKDFNPVWEITLVSPPQPLDIPTAQSIRALVTLEVQPLQMIISNSPRSILAVARCTYLHLQSSPIGEEVNEVFHRCVQIDGTNPNGGEKRGRSAMRVYPSHPTREMEVQQSESMWPFLHRKSTIPGLAMTSYNSMPQSSVRDLLSSDAFVNIEPIDKKSFDKEFGETLMPPVRKTTLRDSSFANLVMNKVLNIVNSNFKHVGDKLADKEANSVHPARFRKSFMMTGFIEHSKTKINTATNFPNPILRSSSCPPMRPKNLEKARIASIARLMGYQGHFHDLQRIVVKSIKAISYKLTMPVSANQFSHIQPFPIFKIFDSSSPFYKCKPYVARNKRQRQHYMQFDSLKGTNGLLTTMELVPQMMIKTKKENTPGKELTFRVTLGGATSGIETSQISQLPAKQVNESDGLSNRVFLKDQEDQFFIVNDRNGTSFAGSDARSGSEVREAKIIRNEVRNPKFLKRQSIIFTSILAVSYFVAMITRVYLDSENTSIMRDALAQNEKVLLLTQAINPISALFKETIWATMQNDAGVSFDRLGHNLLDATKFAARIKLSEAYLASNYTDVKTTYFTTLTQGNETVYVVSNLKYSLYTLIHLLDFHIAALTTNTKSVMDAHRDDTSSTGYSPVSFNEFMLMINDPIARVRLISRTIFYSMWDKLVSLSDLNTKSSRNASSWTLILATFITSLVLIGAFLLIMGKE